MIEFKGSLKRTGESEGHYICDIKDKSRWNWFRTNDNSKPIQIRQEDVSKFGYVILYKKV